MGMVCHMDKKKVGDLNGMRKEDDRSCDSINKKNPDLDLSKTKDNYTIARSNKDGQIHYVHQFKGGKTLQWDAKIKNRVKAMEKRQVKTGGKKIRKDAVVCGSFVLGADADFMNSLSPAEERKYFRMMYEFLENRYGAKNIVSFTVHKDEGTVGAHCRVFPEIDGKLCAKEKFSKKDFDTLQKDLYAVLHKEFPTLEAPEFGNTQRKHLNELTYKVKSETEKLASLEAVIGAKSHEIESLEQTINEKWKLLESLNNRLEELQSEKLNDLDKMIYDTKVLQNQINLLYKDVKNYEQAFQKAMEKAYSDVFDEQTYNIARTRYEAKIEPQRTSLTERLRRADEEVKRADRARQRTKETVVKKNKTGQDFDL